MVYSKSALNANPTIGGANVTEVDLATPATGVFTVSATGLTASSGYSYRAFATNSQGTTYTTATTFSTLGSVTPPASYPSVAQGATTVSQTITLSAAPASGLTVTPSGTGLTFTPSAISFTSSDTSRSFTVSAASNAAAGAHTITYTLSGTNAASYVTPANGSITVFALSPSTTTLTSSVTTTATAPPNNTTVLTATVTSGATGTVTFKDGVTNLTCSGGNPAAISGSAATCTTSFSAVGSHSLTAIYSGDSTYATSTSNTVSQTVAAHPTVTSFTASSVTYGSSGNSINVATGGSVTGSPTAYTVAASSGGTYGASAATSGGGTVSIDATGTATYAAPTGYRGNDTFFVKVTNALETSSAATVTVPVGNPTLTASVTGTGATHGTALSGYSIAPSGGKSPYTCNTTPASGALPGSVTLNADCTLTGTPSTSGTFTFSDAITDSSIGPSGANAFTQTVSGISFTVADPVLSPTVSHTGNAIKGSTITYTLTPNISGGPTSTGVLQATWSLPTGFTFVNASGTGWSCSSTSCVTSTPQAVGPGNPISLLLNVGTTASSTTTLPTVTMAGGNASVATSPADPTTVVNAQALTVAADVSPTSINTAQTSTLTATFTNPNTFTLSSVTGSVTLPTNLTGSGPSGTCPGASFSAGVLSFSGGLFSSGGSCTLTLTVSSTTVGNYPIVTSAVNAPASGSATPTVTNTHTLAVTPAPPTLGVAVSHSGNFTQGQTGNFTITPSATVGDTTSNLTLTSTLPSGFTFNAGSGTNWDCTGSAGTFVSCVYSGTITAGASGSALTLTVNVATSSAVSRSVSARLAGGGATSSVLSSPDSVTVNQVAANIALTAGNNQSAIVGHAFATNLKVTVTDAGGVAMNGTAVVFTATSASRAKFSNNSNVISVNTDASGVADAGTLTAQTVVGGYSVTVTSGSATNSFSLTNTSAPTISGLSPASGPTIGGTTVTLTGTNLAGTTGITFGGVAGTSLSCGSNSCSVVTPAGSAGAVDVVVSVPGGSVTGVGAFTYVTAPTPTLTFTTPTAASVDLGGAAFTNAATSSVPTGGAITYGSGTTSTATVNSTTGAITPVATGTSVITATQAASAGVNLVGTQTYTLTVNPTLVATQSVASKVATFGVNVAAYTPVTASGGSGTYSYALYNAANTSPSSLPSPMTFNTSTGAVSGAPGGTSAATTYTVRVTDTATAATTATNTFSLAVVAPPTTTQAVPSVTLTLNTAATSVTPVTATGGAGTLTYSISPALSAGLSFNTATGAITGTPTATNAGAIYTVTVTDANGATGTNTFSLRVVLGPTATQSIASTSLAQNVVATAFTPVTGGGGATPLSYSVSPTLPAGLSISSSTGAISGTPTVSSSATTYTVTVSDANGATATNTFSLTVNAAMTSSIAFSLSSLPVGNSGTVTVTFTNPNAVTTQAFSTALHSNTAVFTRTPGLGGTCGLTATQATVPSASQVNLNTLTIAPGSCTVTFPYKATAAGVANWTLDSFTPPAYPTTAGTATANVTAYPSVTALSVTSGPAAGGTTVNITGTGFSATAANNTVNFGGAAATVTAATTTQLTVTSPAGTGTVDVTVTVNGQTSLTSGADKFTYRSSVATLSNLALSSGTLAPVFASGTTSYTASVANAVSSITVTPTVTDATATIKVNGTTVASGSASGSIALNVGANTITTVVTAQDGTTTQTYTVVVTRAGSANANLSNLSLSSGTLAPTFASATTSYTASVANAVNSITVTPATTSGFATVTVNGTTVASGSASGSIALNVGANTITTVVTAQDGTTTQTYTVVVTRSGSTNANLSNLALSSGTLSPTFASGTTSYTASVANAVSSITVTPTVTDANATIKVNGTTVASGVASGPIALAVGANTITTVVTAQDGTTTQTYTVVVTRAAASVATLSNLALSSGTLSPTFASGTTSYTASVANAVSSITVTPTVTDATATIKVNGTTVPSGSASGSISLNVGTNTITTVVTAQDGTTTQTYTVVVTRALPPAPVAQAVSLTTAYNTAGARDVASAVTGVYSTVQVAAAPAHGTAVFVGTVVTYTPTTGYFGPDSFTYTATGIGGTSSPATVTVTVGLPPAPVVVSATANTQYNTAVTDDLATLTTGVYTSVQIATPPTNGTVTLSGTVATYTPTTGYFGSDSFTFTATGPGGVSAPATVTVSVANPPPPVATAKAVTVNVTTTSGGGGSGGGSGTNIDLSTSVSNASGIQIVTQPQHGTVTVSGFTVIYTPTPGYFGTDVFTYQAIGLPGSASSTALLMLKSADGVLTPIGAGSGVGGSGAGVSAAAAVNITIASPTLVISPTTLPAGQVGVAYSQTVTNSGGTAPYSYALTSGSFPAGLSLNTATGVISGTPTAQGSFPITISSTDSSTGVGPFTATQAYTLVIAAPTIAITPTTLANADQGKAYTAVTFGASGGTAPYSNWQVVGGALPAGMSLSTAGVLSGTPTAFGSFSFTVQVTDSTGGTGPATGNQALTLVVNKAAVPVATAKAATTPANAAVAINLTTGDTGLISTVAVASAPAHGAVTISGLTATYTPALNYFGPDSFTYTDTGIGGTSAPATVSVTVTPLPIPTVTAQSATVLAGKPVTIDATNGATGSPYTTAAVVTGPATGTVSVSGTNLIYTAPATFSGKASFTFTLSNPFGTSTPATATITVNPQPFTPGPITVQVAADKVGQADVTTGGVGGPFTNAAVVQVSPANAGVAQVVQTGGTAGVNATFAVKFTPTKHFSGSAVVSYTLSNAFATSAPGTVTFNVAARADPSQDQAVRGLISAQTETAVRFAQVQMDNFNQRLETLHQGGPATSHNGLSFQIGDNTQLPGPDDNPFRNMDKLNLPKWFGANGLADAPATGRTGLGAGFARTSQSLGSQGLGSPRAGAQGLGARSSADGSGQAGSKSGGSTGSNGDGGANPDQNRWAFWTGGAIDFGMHRQRADQSKLKFTTSGITIGGDYRVSDTLVLGAGLGYGQDTTKIGTDGTQDKATSYIGAVYGSYHPTEKTFIDGVLGIARLRYDSRRYYGAAPEFEYGKRTGDEVFASITAAWQFKGERSLISPYGRIDGVSGSLDAFTETGGVGALAFAKQDVNSLRSTLGVHGDYLYPIREGLVQPRFRMEYQHEFRRSGDFGLQYADWLDGPVYKGQLEASGRDHLVFGIGSDFRSKDFTLSLDLKTDADGSTTTTQVSAKAAWKF